MLDQLIETRGDASSGKRRGGFLMTTAVLVFSLFASGILWSLFAKNLDMGSEGLELSSVVAPPVPDDVPPPPEVKEMKQTNTPAKSESSLPSRVVNLAKVDEPFIPKEIGTKPSGLKARPDTPFTIGKDDSDPVGTPTAARTEGPSGPGVSISSKPRETEKQEIEDVPPPTIKKTPTPEVKKPIDRPVSKGVVNGNAISLPKPPYPPAAKMIRAARDVNVQVTIDEKGNVISANAVSGHPLLKGVSEQAARAAKFRPTLLSDQPVKVTGIIVYKFAAQ